MSVGRAAWLAAGVAAVVFLPALANGWALDDVGVIERNARAHDVGEALRGFFAPYWPWAGDRSAGLWRPVVILSYAIEWTLSGGRPWLSHATNVLLHAAATALVVLVAAAWLRGWPLVVTGIAFALHPVHVEAVANVVGRAELLAAVLVLAAVLAARRHRAADGRSRTWWGGAVIALVGLGLLVKEHAVVAIPVVALDGVLSRGARRADPVVYMGLVAATLAWLHLWRAVAGEFVLETVAAPLRDLHAGGRVAMMLPVTLDVVRLLVWPFTLAADYNPHLVNPVERLTAMGVAGAVVALAIATLGVLCWRRAPAVTFGLLAGGLAWGPTSNFLIPSGIILSERTLYLPSIAVALVAGWLAMQTPRLAFDRRRLVVAGAVLLAALWVWRVETRIPLWRDTRAVVIGDYLEHPENYRAHARIGSVHELVGDTAAALREFLMAAELWPGDYVLTLQSSRAARAVGNVAVALAEARRGWAMAPDDPVLTDQLAATLAWAGRPAEGLEVVAMVTRRHPSVILLEDRYLALLQQMEAPIWHRDLVRARGVWLRGRPWAAQVALSAAASGVPAVPPRGACRDLRQGAELARNLLLPQGAALRAAADAACSGD